MRAQLLNIIKPIRLTCAIFLIAMSAPLLTSNAVAASCAYSKPTVTKSGVQQSYSSWVTTQKAKNLASPCYGSALMKQNYLLLVNSNEGLNNAKSQNDWAIRFDSCRKGGSTSLLNPATYALITKCSFTTALFPNGSVIKDSFLQVSKAVQTSQPLSYIPVAFTTIKGSVTAMGGTECDSQAMQASIKLPAISNNWVIAIPCYPPKPLQTLRQFMVVAVWLGFAFTLYSIGVKNWEKVSGK